MNNREWLNTLSDDEKDKIVVEKMLEIYRLQYKQDALNAYQQWLQSPRPTTADEDFAEIGFDLEEVGESFAKYSDAFGRSFEIWENDIKFKTCSDPIKIWNNRNIDQIRKIAEKKRKEKK